MPRTTEAETCPQCARPRAPEDLACPACGVIYTRFRPRPLPTQPVPRARARSIPIPAARLVELLSLAARTVESGVPLASLASTGGLSMLPRPTAEKLEADLRAGVPLSQSLDELRALDVGSLALLRAGELHGGIPEAFHAVASRLAQRRGVRQKLLLAVMYPALLVLAAAVVLPLPTAVREGVSAYLARALPPVLGVAAVTLFTLVFAPRLAPTSPLRRWPRWLAQNVPVGRSAALHGALASFAGVLGTCLSAGIPVRKAVVLAAEGTAPHPAFEGAAVRLADSLDRGATLAQALGLIRAMPPSFVAQVATAENTGTLGSVLPALEEEQERKARLLWMTLAALVGGAVFVGVLAILALEVVRAWLEMFKTQAQQIDQLTR